MVASNAAPAVVHVCDYASVAAAAAVVSCVVVAVIFAVVALSV